MSTAGELVHTLHPGDLGLGERGDRLETLLGSCVAIVLTDPRRTLGAMCHFVHAGRAEGPERVPTAYGHEALQAMGELLRERGIVPGLCQAYVVGGGDLPAATAARAGVGHRNLRWALDALARLGAEVLAVDAGGPFARKLSWTVGPEPPRVQKLPMQEQA